MRFQGVKRLVLLLLSGCFANVSCASVNPPSNNRIFSAKDYRCVCNGLPADFLMDEAILCGGGAWVQHTKYLEQCKQLLMEMDQ